VSDVLTNNLADDLAAFSALFVPVISAFTLSV
jgi:hypothetical protein